MAASQKTKAPSAAQLAAARKIAAALAKAYPEAACSLQYANPLQLLVATILSAQCTDVRVNKVTPILFARFPDARALAEAQTAELEALIRSTGFFHAKAKSIQAACKDIVQQHAGNVPRTMAELCALRGVGRKTANVVLGNAFNTPGVVVDTHVGRVSRRLGLTKETAPEKIEYDLMVLFPPERWTALSHELIFHGRACCKAPQPHCTGCPLLKLCPCPNKNFQE